MKILILGGGLAGLAAGYEFGKRGNEVTILEKENFLGGLASSYEIEWNGKKFWIPKTYHHILSGDMTTMKFVEELGLGNQFHKKKVKTGFVYKNKIFGFSTPLEILKFPLPLFDKFKLAKFVFKVSRKKHWDDVERMNAKDWIIKEAGEKNFDVFFDQLIKNKFKRSAEEISAAWFGTRFAVEPSSFLKKFGWIEGGIQPFIEKFAGKIEENGGKIRKDVKITKIVKSSGLVEYLDKGQVIGEKADVILSTIPPEQFLKVIDNPSENIKKGLNDIEYLSCICACIGLDYSPTEYYWINILDKDVPFDVIFNYTRLFEDLAPQGESVIFLITYLRKSDNFWKKSDDEIFETYVKKLGEIFPNCDKKIKWHRITRFENAEAVFNPKFKNPPISDGNIYFGGIYRIFPKIRNMASAIESGLEAVDAVEK